MIILSLDPGVTTGYAFGEVDDAQPYTLIECGQIPGGVEGFVDWMITSNPDYDVLVAESFSLRPGAVHPNLEPVKIEGALSALLGPGAVVYQQPSMKAVVGDERLRKAGLWQTSLRHANDAIIHGLAYAVVTLKHQLTIMRYYG